MLALIDNIKILFPENDDHESRGNKWTEGLLKFISEYKKLFHKCKNVHKQSMITNFFECNPPEEPPPPHAWSDNNEDDEEVMENLQQKALMDLRNDLDSYWSGVGGGHNKKRKFLGDVQGPSRQHTYPWPNF